MSCNTKKEPIVVNDVSIADESITSDWLAYGRTPNERRFSPVEDINTNTVANLIKLLAECHDSGIDLGI